MGVLGRPPPPTKSVQRVTNHVAILTSFQLVNANICKLHVKAMTTGTITAAIDSTCPDDYRTLKKAVPAPV